MSFDFHSQVCITDNFSKYAVGTLKEQYFPVVLNKGTLMQIWKSANIFVFIWK